MVRNESIDVIKGTLIFLVIIGHILLGSLDNNGLRYFIYSFHMPIFFFLSGYLLNLQKISKNTAIVLLRKYWKRMLLQWIIALLVYSLIISYSNFTLYEIVSHIVHPYYHLWYVPTLFAFILMVKLLLIIRDDFLFFVIMISFGLLFYGLNVSIDIGEFRLFFLIFFLLGILLKHLSVQYNNIFAGRWILLSFSAVIVALYKCGISFEFYALYLRLPLVMLICCTSVLSFVNCDSLRSRVLSYLGRHSLEIYLWHVIPILMIKQIIPEDRSIVYYVFTFGLLALLLLGVWFLQKSSLRRK